MKTKCWGIIACQMRQYIYFQFCCGILNYDAINQNSSFNILFSISMESYEQFNFTKFCIEINEDLTYRFQRL